VLLSADDLDELNEIIHWLSQPGIRAVVDAGDREYANRQTTSLEDLRASPLRAGRNSLSAPWRLSDPPQD